MFPDIKEFMNGMESSASADEHVRDRFGEFGREAFVVSHQAQMGWEELGPGLMLV